MFFTRQLKLFNKSSTIIFSIIICFDSHVHSFSCKPRYHHVANPIDKWTLFAKFWAYLVVGMQSCYPVLLVSHFICATIVESHLILLGNRFQIWHSSYNVTGFILLILWIRKWAMFILIPTDDTFQFKAECFEI